MWLENLLLVIWILKIGFIPLLLLTFMFSGMPNESRFLLHLNSFKQTMIWQKPLGSLWPFRFQEIVPLNAGNVLGTEDNGPARKWLALIRKTLNSLPGTSGGCHTPSPIPDPLVELDADFEGSTRQKASSFVHRRSFQSLSCSMRMDNDMEMPQPRLDRRFSVCDRVIFGHRPSDYDPNFRWGSSDDENGPGDSPGNPQYSQYSPMSYGGSFAIEETNRQMGHSRYCLVSSKQMVGIFLTVWVKSDLRDDVRSMKVSCVGRGLMGYLGNKVHFCLWNFFWFEKFGWTWNKKAYSFLGFSRVPFLLACLCIKPAFASSVVI